jgi:diguanylate cyclase (GGDEF)-like protein/PAS domain S-box-containing protein
VLAEQVRVLLYNPADLPVNLINAGLVSVIVWHLYPAWVRATWLACVCIVSVGRALLRRRYARATPNSVTSLVWARRLTRSAFLSACLWGITGSVILLTPDPLYYDFIIFVLGGMMAGGAVVTAAYLPAMLAFTLPTVLPAIVALAIHGGIVEYEMAVMLALFTAALILTARTINGSILENIRLRMGQEALVAKLRASETSLGEAQKIAKVGGLEFDLANQTVLCTAETSRIFGLDHSAARPSFETMLARVHPDDREAVAGSFAQFARAGANDELDFRIARDDGAIAYLHASARAVFDANGRPVRFFTTVQDVTERMLSEAARARLAGIVDSSDDAIISETSAGTIISWNRGAESLFGYRAAEIVGKSVATIVPPERREQLDRNLRMLAQGEHVEPFDTERLRQDGLRVPVSVAVSQNRDGRGKVVGASFIARDITERKIAEHKLQFANVLLKTQLEASLDGILIVDPDQRIISFNQRFADLWGLPLAALTAGADAAVLAHVTSLMKDPAAFSERVRYLYEHPGEKSSDELETADGRSIERFTAPLVTLTGEYLGRAWFFRDVSERKRNVALALMLARHDALTGLANRAVFVEALQHAIRAAKRGEKSFALLYIDLDHFKDVNDTLGHPVGDRLLRAVAERLGTSVRESDTVARFGGDEFAVIAANLADPADAAILAEKLVTAFGEPFLVQGSEIHTGASIGIAPYGAQTPDAETLLSHADVALYRAKSEGRGGYRFFTDAMDSEVKTRVAVAAELRVAVDAGQLFLVYQPQVAIGTGRITGLEALVRWQHPRRGILGPDTFIPVAERIGIIGKLGHWVLSEACRQGKAWADAGIAPGRIGVNVSALQFRTPAALETDIRAVLAQTGFRAHMLELELTESVLMDASREQSDLVQRLRTTGVTISIDDFGTGYSSLEYLRRFPSDRIKIAQNFVKHITTTPGDAAIVRATIGLARELAIEVIAEGVETQEQCDLLQRWGCAQAQGFLFARPLDERAATAMLRAGRIVVSAP